MNWLKKNLAFLTIISVISYMIIIKLVRNLPANYTLDYLNNSVFWIIVLIVGVLAIVGLVFKKPTWLKPILFVTTALSLIFYWTPIETFFAEWIPTSKLGISLGLPGEFIHAWLWVGFVIIGFIIIMTSLPKNIWEGTGRFISLTFVIILILFTTLSLVSNRSMEEIVTEGFSSTKATCTAPEKMKVITIYSDRVNMSVCFKNNPIYLTVQNGYKLQYDFSNNFREKHKPQLTKYTISDFVKKSSTENIMVDSYVLTVNRAMRSDSTPPAFTRTRLNSIEIAVWSVPNTRRVASVPATKVPMD